MRPNIARAQTLAVRTSQQCQRTATRTTTRSFVQTTRLRNQQIPHYEPPSPKDSKGNDARLSRFSKILGVSIGLVVAFGYSTYKHKKKNENGTAGSGNEVGEDGFVKYRLAGREDISSTCSIFTLRPLSASSKGIDINANNSEDPSSPSPLTIRSILFKQPQLQIARAYTLLPPSPSQPPEELRFLIRRERNGEVSSYLHRLQPGAEIELRGPTAEYSLPPTTRARKIIFLAGGTGIAPALQAAEAAQAQAKGADVHILWANRRREDCEGGKSDTVLPSSSWGETVAGWFSPFSTPAKDDSAQTTAVEGRAKSDIVRRLEALKRAGGGRVAVDYFVDEEGSFIRPVDATTLVRGAFSPESEGEEGKDLLFVSGPEGFVSAWAGRKEWVGGIETQGRLGGVLGKLDLRGWEVVKL